VSNIIKMINNVQSDVKFNFQRDLTHKQELEQNIEDFKKELAVIKANDALFHEGAEMRMEQVKDKADSMVISSLVEF
jgi:hypothetical protein